MPPVLTLPLTPDQQRELVQVRDHAAQPYLRERAAALLKIAAGSNARQVALHGLLKRREPDAVYRWVHAYQQQGIAGLYIKAGRGRKPTFSPSARRRRAPSAATVGAAPARRRAASGQSMDIGDPATSRPRPAPCVADGE